jgi:hypothetical protein
MRLNRTRRAVAVLVATAAIAVPGGVAYADQDTSDVVVRVASVSPGGPDWVPDQRVQEQLTLPTISSEMLAAASGLHDFAVTDPRYNTVEVLPDRSGLLVWWHGAPSDELRNYVARSGVPVAFAESEHSPTELRRIASVLVSDPATGVASATVPKDGSAVQVTVRGGADQMGESIIPDIDGVPVVVTSTDEVVSYSRQNDIYAMGGARINRFTGASIDARCTSGFPVEQASTGLKGVVTASHCGAVGSQWVRWPDSTGPTVYPYGNNGMMVARIPAYDGAIIQTAFNNPGFYVSTWDSATYTALNGVAFVPVGAEICYSGSFSGLVCGNIVKDTGVTYSLSGVGTVTGIRTMQSAGSPGAGQGDSGGPGYMLVNDAGTIKRHAATIISAGPGNSTTCPGINDGRVCSAEVLSTSVSQILSSAGWTASHLP